MRSRKTVFTNYKNELKALMMDVCSKNGLFPNSLQYIKSSSKKMTGYRIQIFEEEYPSPVDLPHEERKGSYDPFSIALIKEVKDKNDSHYGMLLIFIQRVMNPHCVIPNDSELTSAPKGYFGFYSSPDSTELMLYLKELMEERIKNYRSSTSEFGCCSSFIECSDVRHCVHPNLLYSTSCIYRTQHLDKGEIFYGKNRNVN